uniref:tellurite resistance TerB family protein n=1 Tax=Desulfosarcina cetonica TaxID=90730 RepID=UPI000AC62958
RDAAPMPAPPSTVPTPPGAADATGNADAVLLIRAMIAAANADGMIDQTERDQILNHLQSVDLSAEEHGFITRELLSPADLDTLVAGVSSPTLARQVYTVSLMAIEVDTPAERDYLAALADRLGLDAATVEAIHDNLEEK